MKDSLVFLFLLCVTVLSANEKTDMESELKLRWENTAFKYTKIVGIGPEKGICRRDPSDVIRLDDKYYIFYTKLNSGAPVYPEGYYGFQR